ncbi:hypothetical protein Tco_0695551 [Tanacetum coccineum]
MRICLLRLRDRAHVQRLCTSGNIGRPFVFCWVYKIFCFVFYLGDLFVLLEDLCSLKAEGFVWDELRCVLVIPLRNLSTITCSLSQSNLVDFVNEYGISLCYDPKLPSSNATALDASKGYIPLYLSLFSIGNLRFPLNNFCLDVFEFFRCHFSLLNPFGVACVTTFVVACKAYGGEATVPLFRSLLTLGLAGDWLTFQKRPGYGIPAIFGDSGSNTPMLKLEFIFGSFTYPYPTEPFYEVLWVCLCRHPFEAQTFPEPILYLADLTDSWEHSSSIPSILIDGEETAFRNFMKKPGQSPSFSVDKGVMGHELVVVGEGCSEQDVMAVGGSKKRCLITKALEEEATVMRPVSKKKKPEGSRRMSARGSVPLLPVTAPKGVGKHPRVLARFIGNLASGSDSLAPDVEEAHAAHNMIYGLHYLLLKDKLGFLTFDELVDVYDIYALQMAVVVKDLRFENAFNLEELSMLQMVAASSEESRKKLVEEVDGLQSRLKETERLGQQC